MRIDKDEDDNTVPLVWALAIAVMVAFIEFLAIVGHYIFNK